MPVRLGAFGAAVWSAAVAIAFCSTFLAGAAAQSPPPSPAAAGAPAQPKPVTGFVPTFEIMRTVRSAGFDPLAPPLREGTTYVLRATDYRGILMRVVLDARTGAIRDVTRIVPAASGSLGVMLPPYGPPAYASPYGEPPYGAPVEYEGVPPMLPGPERPAPPQGLPPPPLATHAKTSIRKLSPPLPRPRPAGLALSQPAASQPQAEKGAVAPDQGSSAPPAAQAKSPASAPLSD